MARLPASRATYPVTLLEGSGEDIPLGSQSVDTVVVAWTLCSIPDVMRALQEMRRVLRPSGRLLFVEHGRSRDVRVARWQDRLTPLWKTFTGGCHLNREPERMVREAGFRIDSLETGYAPGPRLLTYLYEGRALKA